MIFFFFWRSNPWSFSAVCSLQLLTRCKYRSKAQMLPRTFQLQHSNNVCILRKANNLSLIITAGCCVKGLVEFLSFRDAAGKRKKKRLLTVRAKLRFEFPVWCSRSWMQVVALRRLSWLPKVQLLQFGGKKHQINSYLCLPLPSFSLVPLLKAPVDSILSAKKTD